MAAAGQESLLVKKLTTRFGDGIIDSSVYRDEVTLRVDKGALVSICDFLKTAPALRMDYLVMLSVLITLPPHRGLRSSIIFTPYRNGTESA